MSLRARTPGPTGEDPTMKAEDAVDGKREFFSLKFRISARTYSKSVFGCPKSRCPKFWPTASGSAGKPLHYKSYQQFSGFNIKALSW